MNQQTSRCLVFLSLLGCLLRTEAPASAAEETPALVVVVSVDQLTYEYLERFRNNFRPGGLVRQTQKSGVWYSNCKHQHAFTFTGPGHAVQLTGTYPNRHGIIGNSWFDRKLGKLVYCVSDPEARLIGAETKDAPVSPRKLLSETVGDQLKLATGGRSKVFTIAIKDRAAILMAGHLANSAVWMSNEGDWISSSHYGNQLPAAMAELNASGAVKKFANTKWQPHLDRPVYYHGEKEDSFGENPRYEMTMDFPHVMPAADNEHYFRHLACSPFGNEWTLYSARALIQSEKLGQDEFPDILGINLSPNDYVGHSYGPHSLEVEDMTYRTDLMLGQFADFIRTTLGGKPFVMFVTADHGVGPIPERARRAGLAAERNPLGKENGDTGNIAELRDELNKHLQRELQIGEAIKPVQAFVSTGVYLDRQMIRSRDFDHACRLTRDWVLQHPAIVEAMTREDLLDDVNSASELHKLLRHSYHVKRSPDVLFVLRPFFLQSTAPASHGSPWSYDRHVPLLVLGSVNPGRSSEEVSPACIATTIARLLKVELPSTATAEPLSLVVP